MRRGGHMRVAALSGSEKFVARMLSSKIDLLSLVEGGRREVKQHVSDDTRSVSSAADVSEATVDLLVERERELHFFDTRPELEQQLAGQWVAIDGDKLISHGSDLADVLKRAEGAGHPNPLVSRVFEPAVTYVY